MADKSKGDTRAQDAPKVSDTATAEKADSAGDLSRLMWAPGSGDTGSGEAKTMNGSGSISLNDGFGIVGADGSSEVQKKEDVSRPEILDKGEKSDDPSHPSNWKTDKFGNVTEAGPDFKAEYNDKGELQSVTQGDDTWRLSGPGQIEHSWTDSKGTNNETLTDITSFSTRPYFSDRGGGLLGGMKVEIGEGKSSISYGKKIYQDAAHSKFSDSVLQGLVQGAQKDQGN